MGIWIINELLLPVLERERERTGGGNCSCNMRVVFASKQTHKIYALAKKWGKEVAAAGAGEGEVVGRESSLSSYCKCFDHVCDAIK